MVRPLRIEYPGALYHVMSHGNAEDDIFLCEQDRVHFLDNLEHCVELYNLVCHAYCLMDNHYHLLLETPDGNLSSAMRDINGNYTQNFNVRHDRAGHVLKGRYKSNLIEKETYLLEVARYVVNNPVRAGIVQDPSDWRWSSYNATTGRSEAPKWLEIDFILGLFSKNRNEAQKYYQQFVLDGIGKDSPFKDVGEGIILGSLQFVHWVWENVEGSEEIEEIPREQRIVGRPSLEEIFAGKMTIKERNMAIKLARFRCGYLTTEIAKHVGLDRSVVGKISRDKT